MLRLFDVSFLIAGLLFSFPFWYFNIFNKKVDFLKHLRLYKLTIFSVLAAIQTFSTALLIRLYRSKLIKDRPLNSTEPVKFDNDFQHMYWTFFSFCLFMEIGVIFEFCTTSQYEYWNKQELAKELCGPDKDISELWQGIYSLLYPFFFE